MYIFDNENSLNNASITDSFFSQTRSVDAKVELINKNGTVIKTLDSTNDLISLEITRSVQSENDFMGCAISKEYTLSIMDKEKSIDFTDTYVKPYIGVKVGEAIQYAPFPKANVYEANYDTVKKVWSLTCYDDMQKLNTIKLMDFRATASVLTLRAYASEILAYAGINLSANSFYNENMTLSVNDFANNTPIGDTDPYRPNFSGEEYLREVIAKIAQTALSNAVMNRSGELEFISIAKAFTEGTDPYITSNNYFSFSTDEKFGPINTIVLAREETEDNIYYPDIDDRSTVYMDEAQTMTVAEHIALYGVHELKIFDNPFFDRSTPNIEVDTRYSYAEAIFNKMKDKSYTAYNLEFRGNPAIDEGNRIKIKDLNGNEIETTYFSDKLTYNGGLKATSEGKIISQTQTEYDKAASMAQMIRTAQIKVDKNEGEIISMTKDITNISEDLKNNYLTSSAANTLIQTAREGLTNTFTTTGGSNILRNTGLHFGSDNNYESWTSTVENTSFLKKVKLEAVSGTSIALQNATVSQSADVPNGKYTLSMKYKRLETLANASISFCGQSITLGEEGSVEKVVDVATGSITVSLTCNMSSGYEVWDLMCNSGESIQSYSQNANEITSETVNISKGIEVKSSSIDIRTRIDSDGLRVLPLSEAATEDNTIMKATQTGIVTNEFKSKSTSVINGVLFTRIGDQTWITGVKNNG